jgi:hypothetical protein
MNGWAVIHNFVRGLPKPRTIPKPTRFEIIWFCGFRKIFANDYKTTLSKLNK